MKNPPKPAQPVITKHSSVSKPQPEQPIIQSAPKSAAQSPVPASKPQLVVTGQKSEPVASSATVVKQPDPQPAAAKAISKRIAPNQPPVDEPKLKNEIEARLQEAKQKLLHEEENQKQKLKNEMNARIKFVFCSFFLCV